MQTRYLFLADAMLVLHAMIVFFNVGALPVIWLGYLRGWRFVRNFYLRMGHLVLIGFVTAETVFGAICPLTTWEDQLRLRAGADARYEGGYVAHWLHRLIFFDCDQKYFIAGYVVFFVLVVATLVWVWPDAPRRRMATTQR
jgi:hypothetical protein